MNRILVAMAALAGAASCSLGQLTITTGDVLQGDRTANLIKNGSFEVGNPGIDAGWTPGSHMGGYPGVELVIPDWTPSWPDGAYGWWGPLGFAGDPAPHGNNMVYFGNYFNSAGATVNNIAANGVITFNSAPTFANRPAPVTLEQTVAGLDTSLVHRLEFWVSGESNTSSFTGTGLFGLQISGESLTYLLIPASSNSFGASERYYVDFTPKFSSISINFLNWGHISDISGTGSELVLDDVILNVVPSPASAGLLALGGFAALRRRR